MKNLFKNVVRSFKNNKISLIGLVFLLFFGLGTFCVMSNTTANITNRYNSIAKRGNLHDITASELYEVGTAAYMCSNKGFEYKYPETGSATYTRKANIAHLSNQLCASNKTPERSTNTYCYVVPTQTRAPSGEYTIYTRIYNLTLDPAHSTGLYQKFAETQAPETKLEVKVVEQVTKGEEPNHVKAVQTLNDKAVTDWTNSEMDALMCGAPSQDSGNALFHDYNLFLKAIQERTTYILNLMTAKGTPLAKHIDELYHKEMNYRFFKSINVTASQDNIFYKVINSNPTDTINKVVLFKDTKGKYGNQLFDVQDWAPYNSPIKFVDSRDKEIAPGTSYDDFVVPSTFEELVQITPFAMSSMSGWSKEKKFVYSQIIHIRFKRMLAGDRSTSNIHLEPILESLSAINMEPVEYAQQLFDSQSPMNQYYEQYINNRQPSKWNENIIISMNGNVVINWSVPTPLSCTMVNWTSHFSIINPQHLQANNKYVIRPENFNHFEPYKEWYKVQFGVDPNDKDELDKKVVTSWFNTLNNKQFNFWWRPQTDTSTNSMKYTIYKKDGSVKDITVVKGQSAGQWWGVQDSSIVSCGEYNQIVWGCGLSPDFMYPVVDVTRPTPNVKTECLTYCNDAGYKTLKLSFFNSPTEDFLIAKFMPSVTTTRQQEIIDELNDFCSKSMLFPKDIKAVYRANDTDNVLNTSAFRVSYIPNLVGVIQLVTIILSVFLAILALVICLIIIKRYVENNRVNIGIMRANGISKIKIALSLLPFALFPAIVGGLGAYLVGLFLQIPMLKLFGNYWTLPTPIMGFDWISMVFCIFVPFILFGIITILSALWVLRTKSVELMKAGSEFKTNGFSKIAKKPFKYFGVLTRFRVALAFNSLSRLIMLALMSCLTMTSLVFAMTSFGKLNQSQIINSSQFDYSFNLQLTTPTTVGSIYNVEDWSSTHGLGYTDPKNFLYNVSWNHDDRPKEKNLTKWYSNSVLSLASSYREAIGENGNLMLPTVADATGQVEDLQYLMNKTCSKLTLDYVVGLGSLSSNPWEIATALMPANSRNIASDSYNRIIHKIGSWINAKDPNWIEYKEFFSQDDKGELIQPYEMAYKSWLSRFSDKYVKFLVQIYRTPELIADEYRISYNVIPINWAYPQAASKADEQYSYLTGAITAISSPQRSSFDKTHEITIEGIKDDSQFIKLTDKGGNSLNTVLTKEAAKQESARPIIVNAFAAHKYNLGIGSTFSIKASNTADRIDRKIHPDYDKQDKSNECTFKVVGISQGTNGEAFYCTQIDANNVLGLPNGKTWNKTHKYMLWQEEPGLFTSTEKKVVDMSSIGASSENKYVVYKVDNDGKLTKDSEVDKFNETKPVGFNGLYTADKSGRPLTSSLSLYSYSGLYPGTSVFDSDSMRKLLASEYNLALANYMTGINDPDIYSTYAKYWFEKTINEEQFKEDGVNKFIELLRRYFGDTTMVTCMCGAQDVAASDLIYKNLISTFNLAETTIMSVIIPITIIVVGIISNLIINDSRRMAAMLKALGYSDKKNAMSILALFVPTIVLGLLLAIPASMGVATGYQALIFGGANILIDVSRKWWYYLAAVGGIGVILVATYVVGWASLKRDRLVDRIK